jgi:DNA-binding Lrp family transcriptional regulator
LTGSKLNVLDSKILKTLFQDGRKSFAEIASECDVTKNKIWKRYKAMERKGIITGATIQVNFAKFGFDALATFLINVEAQQIEQVMAYVGQIPDVRVYRQYNSIYNIRAFATLKDLNELDQVKQAIKRKHPAMSLKTYIWTDIRNIPENLALAGPDDFQQNVESSLGIVTPAIVDAIKTDELDTRIIEKLILDGRASFAEIAKRIGTSTDTVVKRYHKLRKKGAIKVSIQIDPNKIGYKSILDFNIAFTAAQDVSGSVVDSLARIPDVIIITKTSGDYDLQLTAMIRDVTQSFAIQDQIIRTCRVTKMETSARKIPTQWPTYKQYMSTM